VGVQSADLIPTNLVGRSRAFLDIVDTVRRIANFDVLVSIYGETGTGKELIARALHYCSSRSSRPFIPVNCGALQDTLFESELFGYEKGAFTDARQDHIGLIGQANKGTLFLDEIEALSSKGQVALLRFLQDRQYRRVGGKSFQTSDVRIVVGSNVDLDQLRHEPGRFRDDLFYRLQILPIHIPPLRERRDDISVLAKHFMTIFRARFEMPGKYLSRESIAWLLSRSWPGNVRELENTIQRGFLLAPNDEIGPEHLQAMSTSGHDSNRESSRELHDRPFNEARALVIEQFERAYLQHVMSVADGNVTQAARLAGKERRTLGRLLKKHCIPTDGSNPA
jgi:DNA-binding NtrC family response regulator